MDDLDLTDPDVLREADPRGYVVNLLMVATGFDPLAVPAHEQGLDWEEQRQRLQEVVDIMAPTLPQKVDPDEAVARLVEAARAAYHAAHESAIGNPCPGGARKRSEYWREAIWEAEWPEDFDLFQEVAAALEPFGGVGPEPGVDG